MRAHLLACFAFTVLVLCTLLHFTAQAVDVPPLRLMLSPPHFAFAPLEQLTCTVRILPIDSDRELWVSADGPLFYRSSFVQIDGMGAAKTHYIRFLNLPVGVYAISATLGPNDHSIRARVQQELTIMPR